jgi:hypothetical protein
MRENTKSAVQQNKTGISKLLNGVAVVVLFGVVAAFWVVASGAGSSAEALDSKTAIVSNEEGVVCELPLSQNTTYVVESDLGVNTIVVENGEVYMLEADCPGHDCMNQGRISSSSQTIVCLPHKVWIEITSTENEESFDAIGS